MTLKTLTGPSTRDALADARRLFGDVVLLQSSPGGLGTPASVTVAFDEAPRAGARALSETTASAAAAPAGRPLPAAPAVPGPAGDPAPRAYGYGAARQVRPAAAEPISPAEPLAASSASAEPTASEPTASADEVAALRARLAELEATLREVRASAPPPAPRRPPVVLVGRAGSGKTTLALRLAQTPGLTDARCPAVLVVAPEAGPFLDPAPSFWDAGVPVAVVRSADDVAEAMRTFADADLLLVDTPGLPVDAGRAGAAVARLGRVLAPLATVEVVWAADASRAPETLTADALGALGLQPDALALTRLDEATCAPGAWERHLGLRARFASAGPDLADVSATRVHAEPPAARVLAPPVSPRRPASPRPAPPVAPALGAEPVAPRAVPGFSALADLLDAPAPARVAPAVPSPAFA